MGKNLDEFMAAYDPEGRRVIFETAASRDREGNSPFIVIHSGRYVMVLSPMIFDDHLCLDVHPFLDGQDATAGVYGMTQGKRFTFPDTGSTSHGWASANLIAVLLGEQGEGEGGT